MTRQHTTPILLPGDGAAVPLMPVQLGGGEGSVSESVIRDLVHAHPRCLPIAEIDPAFVDPIAICTELRVSTAGEAIDNFLVTRSGLPILVECKLWRNPEARREVVGQLLDYAKELARWTSADVQREVQRRLGRSDDALLALVRGAVPDADERSFHDMLSRNLRRGRFLLIIVGDGIREGVEAIAEYVQRHAGLHFSLGLVEMPIYRLPDDRRIVVPRILAHTKVVIRDVVAVPEGYRLQEADAEPAVAADPELSAMGDERQAFWRSFLEILRPKLDDPEQPVPSPARQGYLKFQLPAPSGSCWLNVYRYAHENRLGVSLSSTRGSIGEAAMQAAMEDWEAIAQELHGNPTRYVDSFGRPSIREERIFPSLAAPQGQADAYAWLAERVNSWVNTLRPRIRSAAHDAEEQSASA